MYLKDVYSGNITGLSKFILNHEKAQKNIKKDQTMQNIVTYCTEYLIILYFSHSPSPSSTYHVQSLSILVCWYLQKGACVAPSGPSSPSSQRHSLLSPSVRILVTCYRTRNPGASGLGFGDSPWKTHELGDNFSLFPYPTQRLHHHLNPQLHPRRIYYLKAAHSRLP